MRKLVDNSKNVEKNLVRVAEEPGIVSPIRAAVLKQFGRVTKETVKQYKAGVNQTPVFGGARTFAQRRNFIISHRRTFCQEKSHKNLHKFSPEILCNLTIAIALTLCYNVLTR